MTITIQDVYDLNEGLSIVNERELPTAVAYKMQKISLKVREEVNIASGLRMKLIEKYKEKKNEDGTVKIKQDKIDVFNKEIKDLMALEVKVKLDKIKLSDLGDTIKPSTLILIDKILKEGDE